MPKEFIPDFLDGECKVSILLSLYYHSNYTQYNNLIQLYIKFNFSLIVSFQMDKLKVLKWQTSSSGNWVYDIWIYISYAVDW